MFYYSIIALTDPISISNCSDDVINNNNNINVNPVKITENNRTALPLQRRRNLLSNASFMAYKCLPGIILLLMVVIGILSGFTAIYTNKIQRLTDEVKKKDDDMLQMQRKNNITLQLNENLNKRESENNLTISALKSKQLECQNNITILNNQLAELQENQSKINMIFKQMRF
jgi:hypothetical protein